jgi:pyruvate,water dikinase
MTDDQILRLADIGNQIEMHYGRPMDIEWAMEGGEMYIVQARPVTTLNNGNGKEERRRISLRRPQHLVKGLGASPGKACGPVRSTSEGMSLDVVKQGDVLVTQMTTPDMVPA